MPSPSVAPLTDSDVFQDSEPSISQEATPEGKGVAPKSSGGMYLRTLRLQGFRSCLDVTITFQPTLTLLVGENNSGKSNIIDALRLATVPLSGRRTRYFEFEDVSKGHTPPVILTTEFENLTSSQVGHYQNALDLRTKHAWYTTKFIPDDSKSSGVRVNYLCGKNEILDQDRELRERINHVYLAPLRDAQAELDSARGNRLELILKYLVTKEERERFLKRANETLADLEQDDVISKTRDRIQKHISDITRPIRPQRVGIGFSEYNLQRLARGLRIKMSEHGVELADIADSGLGYANLLFMATVILELQKATESELTLFLVEEPEAHLHPQLQAVLLEYLREQAESSVRDDNVGPAGRIQVIATTHSPNLASAVGSNNIVVLRTVEERASNVNGNPIILRKTVVIPLCSLELEDDERRKIDQYLDVTRAELLFTRRAVLVEGIAEAVILPAIVEGSALSGEDHVIRPRKRAFRGISVIPIGSVDFAPYLKLLLQPVNGVRLVDRLVVITDGDPQVRGIDDSDGDEDGDGVLGAGSNRRVQLEAIARKFDAEKVLLVAESKFTLEADLFEAFDVNGGVLYEALKKQRPRCDRFWKDLSESENPSEMFYSKLRATNGKYIRKGEFAHDVASAIRKGAKFICPEYLRQAIEGALDGMTLDG